jgi:hypothetical protein
MILKRQKPLTFINDVGCIVDLLELANAVLWYAESKPVQSPKHIYMHGQYPAVSVYREKIHVHRLLILYRMRSKIASYLVVHHKDGNKLNCLDDNLALDVNGKHLSMHNKGKTFTEEHKQRISEANKKRKGMKLKKRVDIPLKALKYCLKLGWSINRIANHYNCDWSTVKARIYENPELRHVSSCSEKGK